MAGSITVTGYEAVGKGKTRVSFDTGLSCLLYRTEIRMLQICEDGVITEEDYHKMLTDILAKRAKKRTMHLLEKMDRTEKQLRDKLLEGEYPQCCIDEAIEYVKSYHYLDDARYAANYVRYAQEKKSRMRITQDLMAKGIRRDLIDAALEEEYVSDEDRQIRDLLEKRHFSYTVADEKEIRRTYAFLLRRGFQSSDILRIMKQDGVV